MISHKASAVNILYSVYMVYSLYVCEVVVTKKNEGLPSPFSSFLHYRHGCALYGPCERLYLLFIPDHFKCHFEATLNIIQISVRYNTSSPFILEWDHVLKIL